jgi:SAM-dependent methyltransferase
MTPPPTAERLVEPEHQPGDRRTAGDKRRPGDPRSAGEPCLDRRGVRYHRGVVVGNVYDKYATRNPIARLMMRGFLAAIDGLGDRLPAREVLEVGCGEGHLLAHLRRRQPERRMLGVELSPRLLAAHRREHPDLALAAASIEALPFADRSFDLVVACEVLEHLDQPAAGLRELVRVARRHLLLSVPDEPLWRMLNCARGRYLRHLGNTPGHVQHYGRRGFIAFVEREGRVVPACSRSDALSGERRARVVAVRSPLPWTVVLAEVTP